VSRSTRSPIEHRIVCRFLLSFWLAWRHIFKNKDYLKSENQLIRWVARVDFLFNNLVLLWRALRVIGTLFRFSQVVHGIAHQRGRAVFQQVNIPWFAADVFDGSRPLLAWRKTSTKA